MHMQGEQYLTSAQCFFASFKALSHPLEHEIMLFSKIHC